MKHFYISGSCNEDDSFEQIVTAKSKVNAKKRLSKILDVTPSKIKIDQFYETSSDATI